MSVNIALIRSIYPPQSLGRGVGLNALVVGSFFAAGPTIASLVLSLRRSPALFPTGMAFVGSAAAALIATSLFLASSQRPLPQGLVLHSLAGEASALDDRKGKPFVINLWASWCPPCRREMPALIAAAKAHPEVRFVFANQGEDADTIAQLYLAEVLSRPFADPDATPTEASRSLFDDNLAHTVLAVPIAQERAQMHLDTVCTMVDVDAVVMYPNIVDTLAAYTIVRTGDGLRIGQARPFVEAAAEAMGIEKLRVIDTGLDAVTAEREQWDDGNNTLALAPGVVVGYERNSQTNARLADAGIEVLPIEASELGTGRGGPRCMSCPISRDPA